MEQQSNNNLVALFQKAAEEYPLKTNNENWDIVAAKLHTSPTALQTQKNKNRKYLALLLILLIGGGGFFINSLNKSSTTARINEQKSLTQKKNNKKPTEDKTGKSQSLAITEKNNNPGNTACVSKERPDFKKSNTAFKNKSLINADVSNAETNNSLEQRQLTQQPKPAADNLSNQFSQPNAITPGVSSSADENIPQQDKAISQNTNKDKNLQTKTKSTRVNLRPQPKTFYGTFFFSPDFSTIKFQHVNKPGYIIGVGLGYRINNRLSAEVGLQRVHANFYSDGKYFDKSNLKLRGGVKLDALNGNNKLTEVPIALRYNLFKNNYHFFTTAGTTVASITHAEKYDYNVIKRNGDPRDVYKKFSALTGTKFFSSVNVSLGYQTTVSNFFDVKVEPYFQAATKGLGIGNLPVSNFGVSIGIMKDLK